MKTSKCLFIAVFVLFCVSAWGQDIQDVAPPTWIRGTWEVTIDGETAIVEFTSDDIIFDGESLWDLIDDEEIIGFTQAVTASYYEVRILFEDGYWYKERYQKPKAGVITSSVEDSDGDKTSYRYTAK